MRNDLATWTAFLCLTACGGRQHLDQPDATPRAPQSGSRRAEYRRDRAQLDPLPHKERGYTPLSYDVGGTFDWTSGNLVATETVVVRAAAATLPQLVLDSFVSEVSAVRDERGAALPFAVDASAGTLTITLASDAVHTDDRTVKVKIDYHAAANTFVDNGMTLHSVAPRPGDPSQARVVYTFAEPIGTAQWMPCTDDPAERATFAIELAMSRDEDFVANGDRVADAVGTDGLRHVRYATRYTLPTYLMAFAEGDLVKTTRHAGALPVSIWSRRDVPVDAAGLAERLIGMLQSYEARLFPYPFEKYDVVLLPEMVDGEEHAGITFQEELDSPDPGLERTLSLTAHELGHQWFGDYTTIRDWNDLWFKEGMAVLLAKNALSKDEDEYRQGRLYSGHFQPRSGEAIRDLKLPPSDKYTSGPYDRAAWLYTQLRAQVGDARFWATLSGLLQRHPFGVVGSDDVLEAFHPLLGDAGYAKAKASLDAHALPELTVTKADGKTVTLRLDDPENALLMPLELETVDAAGHATKATLAAGGSLTLGGPDQIRVAIEPREIHPVRSFVRSPESYEQVLGPLLVPAQSADLAALVRGPTNLLVDALQVDEGWHLTPASFAAAYAAAGSEEARALLLRRGCEGAAADQAAAPAWIAALSGPLTLLPVLGLTSDNLPPPNLTSCAKAMPSEFFAPRWQALRQQPADRSLKVGELDALGALALPPSDAFAVWSGLVRDGASAGIRWAALRQLVRYLQGEPGFPAPAATELPAWKAFLRQTLATTDVTDASRIAAKTVAQLKDTDALSPLARAVGRFRDPLYQRELVCDAAKIVDTASDLWHSAFVSELGDLAKLDPLVRNVVETPATCPPPVAP